MEANACLKFEREQGIEIGVGKGIEIAEEKNKLENYEKGIDIIMDYLEDNKDDNTIKIRMNRKNYSEEDSSLMLREAKRRRTSIS